MPSIVAAPCSKDLNVAAFQHVLSIYPTVLESFYKTKVKGDHSKRREAIDDDTWRYKDFPAELQQREKLALTKDELERLVKWKITHQTYRPFLLPQIRKNQPDNVELCTKDARGLLFYGETATKKSKDFEPSQLRIRHALNRVCELSGVGPATGTLILSVFDNDNVPFFEDELFAWVFPDHKDKLKYNVKEYFDLWSKMKETLLDTMKAAGSNTAAADLEKIAFVCRHWDIVDEKEKKAIAELIEEDPSSAADTVSKDAGQHDEHVEKITKSSQSLYTTKSGESAKSPKVTSKQASGKRRDTQKDGQPSDARRSKRLKEQA